MKLYSSTFIGIVLAFLMFIGYNGQTIDIVETPSIPNFDNIQQINPSFTEEKVKVEIFDNLFCDSCTNFIKNTLPTIRNLDQETDNIDLRLYFIPDINDKIYYMTAMSLKCTADQNKFWEMHKKIHENKSDLTEKSFIQFGKELEINTDALSECVKENTYAKAIEEDIKYASDKNITFSPTILIGEYQLTGNQPYENIKKIINITLKKIEKESTIKSNNTDIEVLEVKDLTETNNIDLINIPTPNIGLEI